MPLEASRPSGATTERVTREGIHFLTPFAVHTSVLLPPLYPSFFYSSSFPHFQLSTTHPPPSPTFCHSSTSHLPPFSTAVNRLPPSPVNGLLFLVFPGSPLLLLFQRHISQRKEPVSYYFADVSIGHCDSFYEKFNYIVLLLLIVLVFRLRPSWPNVKPHEFHVVR